MKRIIIIATLCLMGMAAIVEDADIPSETFVVPEGLEIKSMSRGPMGGGAMGGGPGF